MLRRKTDSDEPPVAPDVRVLIVEDNATYRAYLRMIVERLGCSVVVAGDGEEALVRLAEGTFDLLLSDLEMPKLDGLDLISHVRKHPTASAIYAVMITSHEDPHARAAALTKGFDDFLPKSCNPVEVQAKIRAAGRLLERQRVLDAEVQRWQALATKDELTNVATRRSFVDRTRELLAEGQAVAVLLFDLDDFKAINDTWGHLTGDRILRDVGALFLSRTRREDVVARYGGDEFVFLVTGVSLEEATEVANRLASDVTQLSWLVATDTLRITATAGVAHSSLLTEPAVDPLIEAADRDLYARKFLKKNPPTESDDVYDYSQDSPGRVVEMPSTPAVPIAAKSRGEE